MVWAVPVVVSEEKDFNVFAMRVSMLFAARVVNSSGLPERRPELEREPERHRGEHQRAAPRALRYIRRIRYAYHNPLSTPSKCSARDSEHFEG